MPVIPTYPGVYVEEIPSQVRTIVGVSTSITAFVGYTTRGPVNKAVRIHNMGDFNRIFGGYHRDSLVSYAVNAFFLNGGSDAYVVRVAKNAVKAQITLLDKVAGGKKVLTVSAANEGAWGNRIKLEVDKDTADPAKLFNLTAMLYDADGNVVESEQFRNLSMSSQSSAFVESVINGQSNLITVKKVTGAPDKPPAPTGEAGNVAQYELGVGSSGAQTDVVQGKDGNLPGADELIGKYGNKTGMYALRDVDLFNILVIPRTTQLADANAKSVLNKAMSFCEEERAFLLVDPSPQKGVSDIVTWVNGLDASKNAAVFFPQVKMPDPLDGYRLKALPPSGAVAGVMARIDSQRGVWKAPAGIEAALRGVQALTYVLTDQENGDLNKEGVNCLRAFPTYGRVVWGSRTLYGADKRASEWKYIPVRRLALFIEESLYRGTQWVVFEPNDEPLWAQIRLNVGAFMHDLFRKGAFQGATPREAYFVKCDKETTTQNDIDKGIVNILVGFAPLKPAEFVIIQISQIAGQVQT